MVEFEIITDMAGMTAQAASKASTVAGITNASKRLSAASIFAIVLCGIVLFLVVSEIEKSFEEGL